MKMKTLFFHRSNDYTGSTRALANMIEREYSGKDIAHGKICVVTIDIKGQGFLSNLANVHIKRIWYPMIKGKRLPLFSYLIGNLHMFLIAVLYSFRFDIFYINTISPYPAVIAGRLFGKKIIYHIHEKYIDHTREHKFLEWMLNNTKATRIYVSEFVRNRYPKTNDLYEVKYNKLPKSFLLKVTITPLADRPRCNIIMLSALTIVKGILNFIELAKILPQYNFLLLLSADKNETDLFFKDAIPQNVSIICAESNVHPFLQKSDLLLNLTIPALCVESFGLTILEAMAYGIPAIVPNVGGPVELVTDGYNGYCVDVANLDIVKQKINESLADSNYEKLVHNALEKVNLFI